VAQRGGKSAVQKKQTERDSSNETQKTFLEALNSLKSLCFSFVWRSESAREIVYLELLCFT
jgi:hypothetical protein